MVVGTSSLRVGRTSEGKRDTENPRGSRTWAVRQATCVSHPVLPQTGW